MCRITRRRFVEHTAAAAGAGLLARFTGPLAPPVEASSPAAPKAIAKRPFGKTGVEVTMVGVGGGSRFYEPVADDELGAEIVRRAIDAGIQVVETSANYGPDGASERRIGLAMKTHRARVFLETKVDARDYDGAMREMERSLKRLQTDHIDLMLHHNVLNTAEVDQMLSPTGAERAIHKMIDQKIVRFHGFSCHVPAVTLDAIKRLEPDAIQLPLNATRVPDFEAEVLPLTKSHGIGVVAMKTCGHGYFVRANATRPDRQDRHGAPRGVFEGPDIPSAADFMFYALSLPIATAVIGMDALSTVDKIAHATLEYEPLTRAQMTSLSERAQVFATTGYWIPRQG